MDVPLDCRMKTDASNRHRQFRRLTWIFGAVLALLCVNTAYIILQLYETSSLLSDAREESLVREAQARTFRLNDFLQQRTVDAQPAICGYRLKLAMPKFMALASPSPYLWTMLTVSLMVGLVLMLYYVFRNFRERYRVYRKLEESHTRLEERVAARTAELARTNDELRREISEREQAENALCQSQESYRGMVQIASDIIYTTDPQGVITFINPVAMRITGFSENEIIGAHYLDFIHPEYREQAQSIYLRQYENQIPATYHEFPILTKAGNEVWLGQNTHLLREGDSIVGFQSIARDISERRKAEALLREAFEKQQQILATATTGIFTIDTNRIVTGVNDEFCLLTGYTKDEVVGKPCTQFAKEPCGRSCGLFDSPGDGPVFRRQCTIETKDGRHLTLLKNASKLRDVDGEIEGGIESLLDVTDLIEAQRTAEQASKAKSAFLANVSHELRTPLNAISGFTELLLDDELSAQQRNALESVQLSTETLLALINDVLDLSKIEADKIDLEEVPFNVETLVLDACELVRARIGNKPIELLCDVQDVPDYLIGDPIRIRQVLVNLFSNAVKFTQRGEIMVTVRSVDDGNDRTTVEFSVQDTGIGISDDKLKEIFSVFTQAHSSSTYGGTGLGLAICRRLARLMEGDMSVESCEGEGSTFRFRARLKKVNASDPATSASMVDRDLAGTEVLLVDDNPTALRILERLLDHVGIKSTSVQSAARALEELGERSFDLLLTDIRMPEMNGYELAAAVRKIHGKKAPRIVALSSDIAWGNREKMATAGFDGFLMKPTRKQLLFSMIRTVLGLSENAKQPVTQYSLKPPKQEKLRVLLAEDNRINQVVATRKLNTMGIEVDLAENGEKAVKMAQSRSYDLILMDLQMPVMDGLEATREIRRVGISSPIVAMTAGVMKGDRERCLEAGMDDYMSKPVKQETLREILAKYCPLEEALEVRNDFRILLVESDEKRVQEMSKAFQEHLPAASTTTATDGVAAYVKVGSLLPHLIVLDLSMPGMDGEALVKFMVSEPRYRSSRIIATAAPDENPEGLKRLRAFGVTQILRRPVPVGDLLTSVEQILSNVGLIPQPEADDTESSFETVAAELGLAPDEYRELLEEFVEEMAERLDSLRSALEQQEFKTAKQIAHALKGGAAEMRIDDMAQSAARIEQQSAQGIRFDWEEELDALRAAHKRIVAELAAKSFS